jgi:hypothetical protein
MIKALWRWLRAEHYSDVAKCKLCGAIGYKSRMVNDRPIGWFCNDAEADEYWFLRNS